LDSPFEIKKPLSRGLNARHADFNLVVETQNVTSVHVMNFHLQFAASRNAISFRKPPNIFNVVFTILDIFFFD
jgi:hypothetical protein